MWQGSWESWQITIINPGNILLVNYWLGIFLPQAVADITALWLMYKYFANQFEIWSVSWQKLRDTEQNFPLVLQGLSRSNIAKSSTPCPVRSDRQTTSLTLTTGVCKACTKWRGCEHHEYSLWRHRLTDCGMEVTLRSNCLASRSWAGKRGVLNT